MVSTIRPTWRGGRRRKSFFSCVLIKTYPFVPTPPHCARFFKLRPSSKVNGNARGRRIRRVKVNHEKRIKNEFANHEKLGLSAMRARIKIFSALNLPCEEWTEVFGSERLTGALLDRLTHHVHILEMNGDSYRLKQSRRKRNPPPDR